MEITRGLSVVNFVLASYSDGAASSPHRFMTEHDVLRFFANVTLFDGSVEPGQVHLTVGGFGVKNKEKQLPLDIYDKVALYLILAAKFGVEISGVYIEENKINIYFDRGYAARAFAAEWHFFSQMPREALDIGADHLLKKHESMREHVEGHAEKLRIEHELREEGGRPKLVVRFRNEAGDVLAHINVWWDRTKLHAVFNGAKEKAERLATILSALGAEVEVKQYGDKWRVELYTDSITAIRRAEWFKAVKAFVEELHRRGVIDDEKKKELLRKLAFGHNIVKIAGVEMSVMAGRAGRSEQLVIRYRPGSTEVFEAAVKALKEAGFEEGVHFTAKKPEGGEKGYIRLKIPAGLWKLEELARQGR